MVTLKTMYDIRSCSDKLQHRAVQSAQTVMYIGNIGCTARLFRSPGVKCEHTNLKDDHDDDDDDDDVEGIESINTS
jgi:hypothetical protein